MMRLGAASAAVWLALAGAAGGQSGAEDLHEPLDRILDTYVRDGLVYYRALEAGRAPLDRYLRALDVPAARVAAWTAAEQQAFWLNAYNAFVLRTVIDHYPIRGRSSDYPPNSIRQIPGAFDRATHRAGGRTVTLDALELEVLAGFGDARLLLAVGRGAVGGGRLRSEAFTAAALERQLTEAVKECAARVVCLRIDQARELVEVSPLFSWRREIFERSFAGEGGPWAARSPIERAVITMVSPHLYVRERAFLEANRFAMRYAEFDWRLNDLTGRE